MSPSAGNECQTQLMAVSFLPVDNKCLLFVDFYVPFGYNRHFHYFFGFLNPIYDQMETFVPLHIVTVSTCMAQNLDHLWKFNTLFPIKKGKCLK